MIYVLDLLDRALGTMSEAFSYDAAVITIIAPFNQAGSGGTSATLGGLNFRQEDFTPSARVGTEVARTAMWTSSTAVVVGGGFRGVADHSGALDVLSLTISGIVTTASKVFSFDAAVVSCLPIPNAAITGELQFSVYGANFGEFDASASIGVETFGLGGRSMCASSAWATSTAISCSLPLVFGVGGSGKRLFLTTSGIAHTTNRWFSFDASVLTSFSPYNLPRYPANFVILSGTNFGSTNPSASARLVGTNCATASWSTSTSLRCRNSGIMSVRAKASVTISLLVGTAIDGFTCDAPVITVVVQSNAANTGGAMLTLCGMNFGGVPDISMSIRLGSQSCRTATWTSASSALCRQDRASGAQVASLALSLSQIVGTAYLALTFDSAVVTFVHPPNTPNSAVLLTYAGLNFGSGIFSSSSRIGTDSCISSSWVSGTSLQCASLFRCQYFTCQYFSSAGHSLPVFVTIGQLTSTSDQQFTYDSPVASFFLPHNAQLSQGGSLTVFGTNFGGGSQSPTVTLADARCGTYSWMTTTLVLCGLSATSPSTYIDVADWFTVTVAELVGTSRDSFTYDAPCASFWNSLNEPTSSQARLLLSGLNFGGLDYTPTIYLGGGCTSVSWTAATTLVCAWSVVPSGKAEAWLPSFTTIASIAGTSSLQLSFDAPVISAMVPQNAPVAWGALCRDFSRFSLLATVAGTNFATANMTASTRLGTTECLTSTWTTATSLACTPRAGLGVNRPIVVTVARLLGTSFGITYDAPTISLARPSNSASSGGSRVWMDGWNYGLVDATPTAQRGEMTCATASWTTASSIGCRTLAASSERQNIRLRVSIATLVGTHPDFLSFDGPCVTYMLAQNLPDTGNTLISLQGLSFGSSNETISAAIEMHACSSASWTSHTLVICTSAAGGSAADATVVVGLGSVAGTLQYMLTFDAPVVSRYVHVTTSIELHVACRLLV